MPQACMQLPPRTFVGYHDDLERLAADEAETIRELIETMQGIAETTRAHAGRAMRSVHAKCHGILEGELTVPPGLPPLLQQGLFARSGRYRTVLRLSTAPGDLLPDRVSTPRGLALKVREVPGERLAGSEHSRSQDFVLVDGGSAFPVPDAKAFLAQLKLLAATTDRAPGLKAAGSALLRGLERTLEAVGAGSGKLIGLGGHPGTHLLGETFHSQVPIRFGAFVAKVALAPASANLRALTGAPIDLDGDDDALRTAVARFFATETAEWTLLVQLCTDPETMPIEDASAVWPESESAYRPVATLRVWPQPSFVEGRTTAVEDRLAFSPWQGLSAHRPLGSVMRARKAVYEHSAAARARHNRVAIER